MDVIKLRTLLEEIRAGRVCVDEALSRLRDLPYAELDYATVDHHRALRQGAPEVILGQGKTAEQIAGVARDLMRTGQNVLVTRANPEQAAHLAREIPQTRYAPEARVAFVEVRPVTPLPYAPVALVCAGTADLPVAEECAETLRAFGLAFERLYDVGVAGLHRLLGRRAIFDRVALVIVVAGMEGALPSVVGGLVSIPVIAVPTSVGYGVGAGGLAALAGMLTSCAAGVTVCNIDNGFGAAFAALRILQSSPRYRLEPKGEI
ncbi:MAG TPA: nickel pincer cofactor biosynthesis protein LarB [Bryobacteraceae bacterium]|nr:nickel pincer cofactor biosynthesis protein LarB [Bryobacteraceae bacterium]